MVDDVGLIIKNYILSLMLSILQISKYLFDLNGRIDFSGGWHLFIGNMLVKLVLLRLQVILGNRTAQWAQP